MALISLQDITLTFGGPPLLDGVKMQIEVGESIGLIGRNGAGKSSLLKLLDGEIEPDQGNVVRQQNLRTAYLPQEVPQGLAGKVAEIIHGGLPTVHPGPEDAWRAQLSVEQTISRMTLDPLAEFATLSAGMKRRVLLGRGLVSEPNLLLLDEPTNHLDIRAITWLEDFLARWGGTLLFVTHDRAFLQKMARRILELDRGRLFDWNCSYPVFLQRKEAILTAEAAQNAIFDKKLAQEEQWIRRGIEARRTRNEGRVRALKRLREIRRERREQPGKVRMQIQEERRSGHLVIEAENISFTFTGQPVVQAFSTTILRGDRVGIIGPNGSGKTTLLRLLIGELAPQQGTISHGSGLEIAYFDQLRRQLDENQSVLDNVGQGSDTLMINGKTRNLIGYLEDFLFTPDRVRAPISMLSGGERNRLLLARLFTRPSNMLVMDEPTNDLDIQTLELLEDLLLDYHGTLLLVSHDRAFLNNLATTTLVMEGDGRVSEYVGGYDDWVAQSQVAANRGDTDHRSQVAAASWPENAPANLHAPQPAPPQSAAPRKPSAGLSYKEQRQRQAQQIELAGLPQRVEALEAEQSALHAAMATPAFYQRDPAAIAADIERLKTLETSLAEAYTRWDELETLLAE